jgi:hypothetical protein
MTAYGTERRTAVTRQIGRYRSKADMPGEGLRAGSAAFGPVAEVGWPKLL